MEACSTKSSARNLRCGNAIDGPSCPPAERLARLGLTLGLTLTYLSLIVLILLSSCSSTLPARVGKVLGASSHLRAPWLLSA